jgi:hypothetical protein
MGVCASVLDELAGTAPRAAAWLLIEQAGPWGPHALTESRSPSGTGRALRELTRGTGVEIALIRRPGRARSRPSGHRRASRPPGPHRTRPQLGPHRATGRSVLSRPGFAAIGAGGHGCFGAGYQGDPLALVCANGRRGLCCALLGRPLAAGPAAAGHAQPWEVTHLGGHRFAPTVLVLPYGYIYGRLTVPKAGEVLKATLRGLIVPEHCRGRTCWDRPTQVAELAIRQNYAIGDADAFKATQTAAPDDPQAWTVHVRHADGRLWRARIHRTAVARARPESCLTELDRYEVASLGPRRHGKLVHSSQAARLARGATPQARLAR